MALTGVLRPGYIQIRVTDMDAAMRITSMDSGCTRSAARPTGASIFAPGTS